jgi:hypothetical protein
MAVEYISLKRNATMKKFGYVLIIIGFLAGALFAVLDELSIRWSWFLTALGAGAAGVLLVRLSQLQTSRSQETLTANMASIETALRRIIGNIAQLNTEKQSIDPYEVRHRIDELFIEDLDIFVQARQSIVQVYGLSVYADVMSCFAAGERYLNRVWSASADGYIDEINVYLEKAQEQFVESMGKIKKLNKPSL